MRTPNLDALAAGGVLFANHWANAAPCGPSRACLYTGMYMQHHRSVLNGTPLDARFTNVALEARRAGYDPVLFGYTDTSVDPRTVPAGDPRTPTLRGRTPGFRAIVNDAWETGPGAGNQWAGWLAEHGIDVPADPLGLYGPDNAFPGAADHAPSWAPDDVPRRAVGDGLPYGKAMEWMEAHGDRAVLHAYFLPAPPPATPQPGRLPRPVRSRAGRALHGLR